MRIKVWVEAEAEADVDLDDVMAEIAGLTAPERGNQAARLLNSCIAAIRCVSDAVIAELHEKQREIVAAAMREQAKRYKPRNTRNAAGDASTADHTGKLSGAPVRTDDLAMLCQRLARALRKSAPDNELPEKAMDYLQRHGLQGSPLRGEARDAADPWRDTGRVDWLEKNGGVIGIDYLQFGDYRYYAGESYPSLRKVTDRLMQEWERDK